MADLFMDNGAPLMSGWSLAENDFKLNFDDCFWTTEYDYSTQTYWADEAYQRAGPDTQQSMYDRIMDVYPYDRMWEYQCLGRRGWQEYGPTIYADQAY